MLFLYIFRITGQFVNKFLFLRPKIEEDASLPGLEFVDIGGLDINDQLFLKWWHYDLVRVI